jgi:hypothetical protein
MGKKSEKLPKEKIRARIEKYSWFRFCPRNANKTPGAFRKRFGWEQPDEHVWAAKPHKHRGLPAQIEVFVRGLFSERISAVCSSVEFCGGAQVNGTPIFSGEQYVCSCVHPCQRKAERERYLSTRTLPVFQCFATLNDMTARSDKRLAESTVW